MKFSIEEDIRPILLSLGYRSYGGSQHSFRKEVDEYSHLHVIIDYNENSANLHIDTKQKQPGATRMRGIKHWTIHNSELINNEKQRILDKTFDGKLLMVKNAIISQMVLWMQRSKIKVRLGKN